MKLCKYAEGFFALILARGLCACGKGGTVKLAENG